MREVEWFVWLLLTSQVAQQKSLYSILVNVM
jgi:hypothetical protein